MARVANLNWIREIRTYQELLFVVRGMESSEMEPEQIAKTIADSPLLAFLAKATRARRPTISVWS